jgi:hypothetical protein
MDMIVPKNEVPASVTPRLKWIVYFCGEQPIGSDCAMNVRSFSELTDVCEIEISRIFIWASRFNHRGGIQRFPCHIFQKILFNDPPLTPILIELAEPVPTYNFSNPLMGTDVGKGSVATYRFRLRAPSRQVVVGNVCRRREERLERVTNFL